MRFLIDECLSPALVTTANERGFEAYHVAHRGWGGLKDGQLLKRLIEEELILVTNNRDDFVGLVSDVELHPGLVVILDNVRRDDQVTLFAAALHAIGAMTSLINKVAEVARDGSVEVYDLPQA
jgi:predicted nuclease of predicted toxin-antitoxin system